MVWSFKQWICKSGTCSWRLIAHAQKFNKGLKGAHEKQTQVSETLLSTCEYAVLFCVQLHCVLNDLSVKENEHCTSENV